MPRRKLAELTESEGENPESDEDAKKPFGKGKPKTIEKSVAKEPTSKKGSR